MTRAAIFMFGAAAMAAPAAASAPPSPPVFWAGCAGALAFKAERSPGPIEAHYAPLARRALAQARVAANPQKLSVAQINGVAISAARTFRTQLQQNPARTPEFEKAVKLCSDAVGKLPK